MNDYDKKLTKLLFNKFPSLDEILYDPEKTRLECLKNANLKFFCVTLTSGGIKEETKDSPRNPYAKTIKEVKKKYEEELLQYLNGSLIVKRIEWRTTPTITKTDNGYKIYSRIIVR